MDIHTHYGYTDHYSTFRVRDQNVLDVKPFQLTFLHSSSQYPVSFDVLLTFWLMVFLHEYFICVCKSNICSIKFFTACWRSVRFDIFTH